MAYTPTGTFIPCKTNGFITDKYSKSYKFSIVKPTTYPGEENVNGVIWVLDIEAMGKSTDPNERQRATWAAGRDYSDRDNPVDYPLVGNYYIVGNLYSFPTENPRNKIPLDENNYNIKKRDDIKYLEFITEKLFRVKETKELNSNSTVDDLIDLALKYLKNDYINTIYGRFGDPVWKDAYKKKEAGEITQEKLDQIYYSLGDLPEYKISLKIDEAGATPPTGAETVVGNTITATKVESPTAVAEVQFKFNVEKTDTFVVVGSTVSPPLEFTIVPNDGAQYLIPDVFNNDDLGDEYKEGDFAGNQEVDIAYDENIALLDNFDYQSSTTTTNTNSGDNNTDDNINFTSVNPGEQAKHLYDFIQKRVKNGYKYLGTPVYNVSMADVSKLLSITKKYGIPLEWVANLINHESAGTWNPSIRNSIGATGLIQFMTNISGKRMTYAKADGSEPVDTDALRSMTFSKHLDYVDGFLSRGTKNHRLNNKVKKTYTQTDLFMTIFYPAAVGKPSYSFPGSVQKANGGIKVPIDYTKKACNKNSPFPLVPDDLVRYVAKLGNELIENSNVA